MANRDALFALRAERRICRATRSSSPSLPRSQTWPIAIAVIGLSDDIQSMSVLARIGTPARASPNAKSPTVCPSRDT
jgi:hypothetical protein